jgi:hypothetical protein
MFASARLWLDERLAQGLVASRRPREGSLGAGRTKRRDLRAMKVFPVIDHTRQQESAQMSAEQKHTVLIQNLPEEEETTPTDQLSLESAYYVGLLTPSERS